MLSLEDKLEINDLIRKLDKSQIEYDVLIEQRIKYKNIVYLKIKIESGEWKK